MAEIMDKYAVVTGSASGIGKECYLQFESKGYGVLGIDVNPAPTVQLVVDLSKNFPSIPKPPDVLVCCHGISPSHSWNQVIDTNLIGVWRTIESAGEMRNASIILISSMTGVLVGNPGIQWPVGAYAASKAALVGLAKQLAVERAQYQVTVNCVVPGPVVTPMTDGFREKDPEGYDAFFGRCLLPGYTFAEDIAEAVLYLTTATRVTGTTLVVDGGYTIW